MVRFLISKALISQKMTERHKTLQEKLQELEAKLSLVFSLPAGSPRRHLHSECIQQRFAFLKNLLSAEIACRPSKSSHLGHIGKRLAELEIAFHEYCKVRDCRRSVGDMNINLDTTASVCSCYKPSLDDDGEATIDLTSPELGSSEDELEPQLINHPRRRSLLKVKVERNCDPRSSDEEINEGQRRTKSPWAKVNIEKQRGSIEEYLCSSKHEDHQQNNNPFRMKAKVGNEFSVEKKERRISSSANYCGALISGMTFGMVLMGAAIAILGDSSSPCSTPHEGLLFYT